MTDRIHSAKSEIPLNPGNWNAEIVKPGYQYNEPWFEYNAEDGLYYRYQYGGTQIDELTGQQLACKKHPASVFQLEKL